MGRIFFVHPFLKIFIFSTENDRFSGRWLIGLILDSNVLRIGYAFSQFIGHRHFQVTLPTKQISCWISLLKILFPIFLLTPIPPIIKHSCNMALPRPSYLTSSPQRCVNLEFVEHSLFKDFFVNIHEHFIEQYFLPQLNG